MKYCRCLLLIIFVGLISIACNSQATPEATMERYFQCYKNKDVDCVQSFLTEDETHYFGKTPLERKEMFEDRFRRTVGWSYKITRTAASASTAEVESVETVTMKANDPQREDYHATLTWTYSLSKMPDGSWKISGLKNRP